MFCIPSHFCWKFLIQQLSTIELIRHYLIPILIVWILISRIWRRWCLSMYGKSIGGKKFCQVRSSCFLWCENLREICAFAKRNDLLIGKMDLQTCNWRRVVMHAETAESPYSFGCTNITSFDMLFDFIHQLCIAVVRLYGCIGSVASFVYILVDISIWFDRGTNFDINMGFISKYQVFIMWNNRPVVEQYMIHQNLSIVSTTPVRLTFRYLPVCILDSRHFHSVLFQMQTAWGNASSIRL